MSSKQVYRLYTDGSCRGNPGPGAWAFMPVIQGSALVSSRKLDIVTGCQNNTTNNCMELTAIEKALRWVHEQNLHNITISIISDSEYCVNGCTKWMWNWEKYNWHKYDQKPIQNLLLWMSILSLHRALVKLDNEVMYTWTRAHTDKQDEIHRMNALVDKAARQCSLGYTPQEFHPFTMFDGQLFIDRCSWREGFYIVSLNSKLPYRTHPKKTPEEALGDFIWENFVKLNGEEPEDVILYKTSHPICEIYLKEQPETLVRHEDYLTATGILLRAQEHQLTLKILNTEESFW